MRKLLAALIALGLPMVLAATPVDSSSIFRKNCIAHGEATLSLIQSRFYLPQSHLYAEHIRRTDQGEPSGPAFAWASGVQLSVLTAAARVDRAKYLGDLRRFVDALDAYWIVANGIGGYNASAHSTSPDRYYDDNAWLALGFVEAYRITQEPRDLNRAKQALRFVLSGRDEALGGGIWWHEQKKESKNTCACAPGICAALEIYSLIKDARLLKTATDLYDWTRSALMDQDGLYFDSIDQQRNINKTKWTYNSALMIRAGALLYDQTGNASYLKDAERTANAAAEKWARPATGAIADTARFAHLLAEAMLELSARDHDPRWENIDHSAVNFVWEHNRDSDGFHPDRWDQSSPALSRQVELIDQASTARAFLRAAWAD